MLGNKQLRRYKKLTKISPLVVIQSLGMLMDDIRCYFVEECSVMGDHKQSAGIALKIIG